MIEAMKMALNALENGKIYQQDTRGFYGLFDQTCKAITELRKAIEEYEAAEPVAYLYAVKNTHIGPTLSEFAAIDYVERPGDVVLRKTPLFL